MCVCVHAVSETTEEQRDWLDAHVGDYGFMRFDVEGDSMWARFILSQTGGLNSPCTHAHAHTCGR